MTLSIVQIPFPQEWRRIVCQKSSTAIHREINSGFPSKSQDYVSRASTQPKSEALEFIQHRRNSLNQPSTFGV
jgi:hypothetical protein